MSNPDARIDLTQSSVVEAADHQTSAQVDGENVILDLEEGIYYGLNPVGSRVWSLIQEPMSVGEIVDEITTEYDVGYEECFDDVVSLLQDLDENNLIVNRGRS